MRGHWKIENSLHWVLDVTFDEDRANGPENLAILRRLTLNLLNKARPKMSVSRKRKRAGWSDPSQEPSSAKCDGPGCGLGPA